MPSGRPTDYRPEYDEQVRKLCLLGHTDKELADYFEISEATLNTWKIKHPSFLESLRDGKDRADFNVSEKLYNRAMGYSHEAVKIVADAKTGAQHIVPYIEHYPPDTTACIFWLKNRQSAKWRDRQEVEHSASEDLVNILAQARARRGSK